MYLILLDLLYTVTEFSKYINIIKIGINCKELQAGEIKNGDIFN